MPTDLSGRAIPASANGARSALERVIAVPPVRDVPNEQSQEFILSAYGNLASGGAAFVALTDPTTAAAFAGQIPDQYRARIDALLLYCPDMVADVAPYLFAQLTINGQLANAWGNIPIYPRAGVASLAFDTVIDLSPNALIGILAKNTDAVNTHFLGVYLHGWLWPKDLVEA